MKYDLDSSSHSVYSLNYHLILVVKYRRKVFDDEEIVDETRWFTEDIMMTKDNDFFSKRSTTYSKHTQSVTADDMF